MLQNPHQQPASCTTSPTRPGRRADWREKLAQQRASSRVSAKKLAQRAIKPPFWAIFRVLGELFRAYTMSTVPQGELFRARTHIRPISAKNVAHEARQHSDIETDNTSAHPQQGTVETTITSAPENRTKNAHFSPAKAMAVSIPHGYQQAKATMVSDNRATWSTGPGCGARGP